MANLKTEIQTLLRMHYSIPRSCNYKYWLTFAMRIDNCFALSLLEQVRLLAT